MSIQGIVSKEYMPDLSLVGSRVVPLEPIQYKGSTTQSCYGSGSLNQRCTVLPEICKALDSEGQNKNPKGLPQCNSTIANHCLMPSTGLQRMLSSNQAQVHSAHCELNSWHDESTINDTRPPCQAQCWNSPKSSPDDLILNQALKLEQFSLGGHVQCDIFQSVNSQSLPLYHVSLIHDDSDDKKQTWHTELLKETSRHTFNEEESEQEGIQEECSEITKKLPVKKRHRRVKRKKKPCKVFPNKVNWTKLRSKSAGHQWQPLSLKGNITEEHCDATAKPTMMAECKAITVLPSPVQLNKSKVTNLVNNRINRNITPRSHSLSMGTITSVAADGTSKLHTGHVRVIMPRSVQSLLPDMPAVEQMRHIVKVFCSDKHSGVLKELGMEVPCAPPATPTPDMLSRYEYVPSMNDVRSQRAVRVRLEMLKKLEKKREEKLKDEKSKREKQELKEKEKDLKKRQRLEVYALNKVMTEFENSKFQEFCKKNGLNM